MGNISLWESIVTRVIIFRYGSEGTEINIPEDDGPAFQGDDGASLHYGASSYFDQGSSPHYEQHNFSNIALIECKATDNKFSPHLKYHYVKYCCSNYLDV